MTEEANTTQETAATATQETSTENQETSQENQETTQEQTTQQETTQETTQTTTEQSTSQEESTTQTETKTEESASDQSKVRMIPKPDEYDVPEYIIPEIRQFAHENEFTQDQLAKTVEVFGMYMQANEKGQNEAIRQAGEAHLNTWGEQKDHNLSLVRRALKQNDPNGEMSTILNKTGYGNHPAVLNFLQRLGSNMQEGGFLKSDVNITPSKKTVAQSMYPNHPSKDA